jgi:hypothetical protein
MLNSSIWNISIAALADIEIDTGRSLMVVSKSPEDPRHGVWESITSEEGGIFAVLT